MENQYKNLISSRLIKVLKERNVSQTELAQMIQKSRAYVSNITKGRYLPKISELVKIAKYLKKPIGYFMGEDSPELMEYTEKAKKWDKIVSMIETNVNANLNDDVVPIPLLDNSKLRNKSIEELLELRNKAGKFMYLSKSYAKEAFKYLKPIDELTGVQIFIRDYPEFGIQTGDICMFETVKNNDIEDGNGKLYGVLYKGDVGIKRIYRDGNKYYFEPIHSSPQIDKISPNDPDLVISGRIVFCMHIQIF